MARTRRSDRSHRSVLRWTAGAALAAIAVALIRRYGVFLALVRSESMRPTLDRGDLLFVSCARSGTPLRRGDLIVFGAPGEHRLLVKRVIGLPGERVEFTNRVVRIDGAVLAESYGTLDGAYRGVFDVPEDGCFVLGDCDEASVDSRSWDDPFVSRRHVRGLVRATLRNPGRRRSASA